MTTLIDAATSGSAALDMALSHALLRAVGEGGGPVLRLLVPAPTLAFGRLDALKPGFPAACAVARRHGFEPVVRLAGGHAAAYDESSLVVDHVAPHDSVISGMQQRFRRGADVLVTALRSLGLDARVGELPGEYCAGAYSLNVGGRLKVGGIAQRVIKHAALTSSVLVVGGASRIRAVVAEAYDALGLPLAAEVTGAVQDADPALDVPAVRTAVIEAFADRTRLVPGGREDPSLLADAEGLLARHAVA